MDVLYQHLTNQSNQVLFNGITNDPERGLYEHQNKLVKGFTSKYNVNKLVYFDCTTESTSAIAGEKQIKGWTRQKKLDLISEFNPKWRDLSAAW